VGFGAIHYEVTTKFRGERGGMLTRLLHEITTFLSLPELFLYAFHSF